jgi:hypothetical protein
LGVLRQKILPFSYAGRKLIVPVLVLAVDVLVKEKWSEKEGMLKWWSELR